MTWLDGSWDIVYIDGIRLLGRVVKLDITPKRTVERPKAKKTNTVSTKDQGYDGASIALDLELWRAAMALELGTMLSALMPRQPGAISNPHTIDHPLCVASNVTKIYVEEYTIGMPKNGRLIVSVKIHEWAPEAPPDPTKQGKSITTGGGAGQGGLTTGGGFGQPGGSAPAPNTPDIDGIHNT